MEVSNRNLLRLLLNLNSSFELVKARSLVNYTCSFFIELTPGLLYMNETLTKFNPFTTKGEFD